jgi:hypothetical protein
MAAELIVAREAELDIASGEMAATPPLSGAR